MTLGGCCFLCIPKRNRMCALSAAIPLLRPEVGSTALRQGGFAEREIIGANSHLKSA